MFTFSFLMASTNLTDIIIELFGWDFMQILWTPLEIMFSLFETIFNINLTPIWEILFT